MTDARFAELRTWAESVDPTPGRMARELTDEVARLRAVLREYDRAYRDNARRMCNRQAHSAGDYALTCQRAGGHDGHHWAMTDDMSVSQWWRPSGSPWDER